MSFHIIDYQVSKIRFGTFQTEESEAKKYNITIKAHDAIGDVLVMKLFLSKLVVK